MLNIVTETNYFNYKIVNFLSIHRFASNKFVKVLNSKSSFKKLFEKLNFDS